MSHRYRPGKNSGDKHQSYDYTNILFERKN